MPSTFNKSLSQTKRSFLDRPAVLRYMDERTRRYLTRLGGFVRKTARRSMRRRKTGDPSPPGEPPRARTGLIRSLIFFSFDPSRRSVVVGPTRLNSRAGDGSVPELHEYGGAVTRHLIVIEDEQGKVRFRTDSDAPAVRVRYPARPYMQPAFDEGLDKSRQFWREAAGSAAA